MKSSILLLNFFLLSIQIQSVPFPNQPRKLAAKLTVNPNFTCNQQMMMSYGLTGLSVPSSEPHKYCPGLKSNCCTLQDAENSMFLWTTDSKQRVEKFYEVYLYLLKYILGFSAEGGLLAKDFATSADSTCKTAANDFLEMNLNPKLTNIIYGSFADSVTSLATMRKGFYCILCDALTQQALNEFWSIVSLFYSNRVYFSTEFCTTLVDKTIQSAYFASTYVKRFSEDLTTLMNCKVGGTTSMTYDVSFLERQQIKNCFFFKANYFFFFCENYCERFDLVRPSDLLDNQFLQLKKFFSYIRDNKDKAFYNPNNNVLSAGSYEERYVTDEMEYVTSIRVFFPAATSSQVDLATYKTDVVYSGGMNPWPSVDGALYQLVIAGISIKTIGTLLCLFVFSLFK